MAEAALALGFAYLGFKGAALREAGIRELAEQARAGHVAELDAADAAFSRCIALSAQRPPAAPAGAVFASTNREMIAVAWKGQAASALTRAAAARDVGHAQDAQGWAAGALRALDAADRAFPSSDTAILRQLAEQIVQG